MLTKFMGRNCYRPKLTWADFVMGRNDLEPLGVVGCDLCPVVKGWYGRTWHGVHALSNLTLIM